MSSYQQTTGYSTQQPDSISSSSLTALRVRNLNVYAGDHHILKNIHLDIPANKVTVLLGPSGCGKTTLLKCMNRLTDLQRELKVSGSIFIGEEDIFHNTTELSVLRQRMGLLSQRPYPLPMSIFKNIAYGLKLKGVKKKAALEEQVHQRLKEVGLWEEVENRLNQPATTLSIGQQQRLCLARGLAVEPLIILADEPTSALDPVSSKIIEDLFRELKKKYTIILVTHILRQAKRLADHAVFMYFGEIVEQGDPGVLFTNPSTPQLQQYIVDGN